MKVSWQTLQQTQDEALLNTSVFFAEKHLSRCSSSHRCCQVSHVVWVVLCCSQSSYLHVWHVWHTACNSYDTNI